MTRRGVRAVVLAGSWARGDAHRASDLDIWAIGPRLGQRTLWRDGMLVNLHLTTVTEERRKFRDPRRAGGAVPGWRGVRPLYDPRGIARRLRSEARGFAYERIAPKCDRWVAEQTVGWAEEAIKLVRALATGNLETAAVQRNLLAEGLGFVMAVHLRIFWDSENEFWERIGKVVRGRWARAQRTALGVSGDTFDQSCRAALALYASTAEAVQGVLTPRQAKIVAETCRAIGARFHGSTSGMVPPGQEAR